MSILTRNNVFALGINLLLLSLPILFFPTTASKFELTKLILFYFVILILTALFILFKKDAPKLSLAPYISLFFTVIVITAIFGENWSQSFWGTSWRHQGILAICFYIIFFFLVASEFQKGLDKRTTSKFIALSSFLESGYILMSALAVFKLNLPIPLYSGERIVGTFSNPNLAAGFLAIALPFSLYLMATSKSFSERLGYYLNIVLIFSSSLLTYSKSGLLAFIVVFTLYLVFKLKRVTFTVVSLGLLISFFALSMYLNVNLFFRKSVYEDRGAIWQNAVEAISLRPVTGYGWENFEYAMSQVVTKEDKSIYNYYIDRAHNEFLEVATAAGIPGLLSYLVLLFSSISLLIKKIRKSKTNEEKVWYQTLVLALAAFITFVQFNFFLTAGYLYFWFILAAIDSS